jgi:hypothetical protein
MEIPEDVDARLYGQINAVVLSRMNCAKASLSQNIQRELSTLSLYAKTIDVRKLLQDQENNREEREKAVLGECELQKYEFREAQNNLQDQYEKKLHQLEVTNAEMHQKNKEKIEELKALVSSQKDEFEHRLVKQSHEYEKKHKTDFDMLMAIIYSQKNKAIEQETKHGVDIDILKAMIYSQTDNAIERETEIKKLIASQKMEMEYQADKINKLDKKFTDQFHKQETSGKTLTARIDSICDRLTKFNEEQYRDGEYRPSSTFGFMGVKERFLLVI